MQFISYFLFGAIVGDVRAQRQKKNGDVGCFSLRLKKYKINTSDPKRKTKRNEERERERMVRGKEGKREREKAVKTELS